MQHVYEGVIIAESLEDKSILDDPSIKKTTRIEPVTDAHKTPWVKQWTLYAIEIPAEKAQELARKLSKVLDSRHAWYADFKRDTDHFIIFRNKIFHITDRGSKAQYDEATRYGLTLGIPEYQLDFSPHVAQWQR